MAIVVDRNVSSTQRTRKSVTGTVVKLMQRWQPMRVDVRLQYNAIQLFAQVASKMQLQCICKLAIRVDLWEHADAAAKLVRHLGEVWDPPLQHLCVVMDAQAGMFTCKERWPETMAVFRKLETL
eukprot:2053509-Rhodomonas_salina.1